MAQSLALAGRKLAGVANNTLSKAQAFAEQYGIERSTTRLRTLYADLASTPSTSLPAQLLISPICALPWRPTAFDNSAREYYPQLCRGSTRPVLSPTSTASSSWTPPRCFICPLVSRAAPSHGCRRVWSHELAQLALVATKYGDRPISATATLLAVPCSTLACMLPCPSCASLPATSPLVSLGNTCETGVDVAGGIVCRNARQQLGVSEPCSTQAAQALDH